MKAPAALACLCLAAALGASPARAAIRVHAQGAVARPGAIPLADDARLADAAIAAAPLPQAYVLGAAWLRPSLREAQARRKAGLLFDLSALERDARRHGDDALAAIAATLRQRLQALPATGRQVPALLDPRPLETDAPSNRPLAAGDRLHYPLRPAWVRITGAVARECRVPHAPLRDAREYLAPCAQVDAADRDRLFVIQPDGHVREQGIALWNRDPSAALAPGATLYVPLRTEPLRRAGVDPAFNRELAAFLATQILPAAAAP